MTSDTDCKTALLFCKQRDMDVFIIGEYGVYFRLGRKKGLLFTAYYPQGVLTYICENIGTGQNAVIKGDWKCIVDRLLRRS